jgi:hypothetical protein
MVGLNKYNTVQISGQNYPSETILMSKSSSGELEGVLINEPSESYYLMTFSL